MGGDIGGSRSGALKQSEGAALHAPPRVFREALGSNFLDDAKVVKKSHHWITVEFENGTTDEYQEWDPQAVETAQVGDHVVVRRWIRPGMFQHSSEAFRSNRYKFTTALSVLRIKGQE